MDLINKLQQGKVHKLTWLCGDQPILKEEALVAIRKTLAPAEQDVSTHFAEAKKNNAAIWTDMAQHAMDPKHPRLIVVRDAEKLGSSLKKLIEWLEGAKFAQIYVVMLASGLMHGKPCDHDLHFTPWCPAYLPNTRQRVVKSSLSLFVSTNFPKTPGEKDDRRDERGIPFSKAEQQAAKIANGWCEILSEEDALRLVRRTNGDLARIRDVCAWVKVLLEVNPKWKLSSGVLDALAAPTPSDGFAEALTKMDKGLAITLAGELAQEQVRVSLFKLARNLSNLEAANRAMKPVMAKYAGDKSKASQARREIAKAAHVSDAEIARYYDAMKFYGPAEVSRRTEALILADANRNEIGALETLVVSW